MSLQRVRSASGFTLIELLIVVAIIAILIPSLARAREQAKIVKCMANMKAMSVGVLTFSEDHNGYGQLMAIGDAWRQIDSSRKRYEYEADGAGNVALSPWPVALGPYIGARNMTSENYFDSSRGGIPSGTRRRGNGDAAPAGPRVKTKAPVLQCPSDLTPVHNVGFPRPLFGILSYSINHDLFGTSIGGGRTWREGKAQTGRRLEGNLINIVRPAEVVVFIDGGNDSHENAMRDEAQVIDSDHGWGAYLPGYSIKSHGLPVTRHSKKGGLSAALADGHAEYLRPLSWFWHEGQTFVERFSSHPRVTPYEADAPGVGGGTTRRR